GFTGDWHLFDVACAGSRGGVAIEGNGAMFSAAAESQPRILATWGVEAGIGMQLAQPQSAGNVRALSEGLGFRPALLCEASVSNETADYGRDRMAADAALEARA
ncbi:unnamed protein product, partial [Prorocentrum cordatum]